MQSFAPYSLRWHSAASAPVSGGRIVHQVRRNYPRPRGRGHGRI